MRILTINLVLAFLLLGANVVFGKGEYLSGPEFVEQAFPQVTQQSSVLWLDETRKEQARKILGHPINGFRVRYWEYQGKTAWILDEIGKELPITIGVVINNNRIEAVKILAYRESRGGEIRYPAFLKQFIGGYLLESNDSKSNPLASNALEGDLDTKLDRSIDGITGATLSVRAVTNISRLALYYHRLATSE